MHELSIAQDICESVERTAIENNAVQVKTIRILMGEQSHLEKRSLAFCLESIAQDTVLENAKIEFIPNQADMECPKCGRFPLYDKKGGEICPKCGGAAKSLPPMDIYIQELVLDVEDD